MSARILFDLIAANISTHAAKPAVIHGDQTLSYDALAHEVDAWAAWVAALGIRHGDRIGIHLPKSPEEIMLIFAAARLGAIFVDIHTTLKPSQVGHIVNDAGIRLLVTDKMRLPGLIAEGLLDRVEMILVSGTESPDPRVTSFGERPILPAYDGPDPVEADVAGLFYTSGSTGRPKGVVFTHANILAGARSVATYLKNAKEDRILSVLPFSFDYGFSQVTTAFHSGGTLVLQPVPMASEIARTIERHAVTGLALVPPAWIELTRYLLESGDRLRSLRYICNSGGRIPKSTLEAMPDVFPGTDIYLMYGLTEAFRATYLDPKLFDTKMGAIGRAIPGTEVFVVNSDTGLCGPGETGELVQRGPLISKGYWGRPKDTADKIKPNPFLAHLIGGEDVLHSGDIVYADEDGILWFVGRNDGMLKSSGYRISPEEIEEFVMATGLVREVVAFGVVDDALGQAIHLAVVWSRDDGTVALAKQCRAGLPSHMVPRAIHSWPDALPRTSSGKYDRPAVSRLSAAETESQQGSPRARRMD